MCSRKTFPTPLHQPVLFTANRMPPLTHVSCAKFWSFHLHDTQGTWVFQIKLFFHSSVVNVYLVTENLVHVLILKWSLGCYNTSETKSHYFAWLCSSCSRAQPSPLFFDLSDTQAVKKKKKKKGLLTLDLSGFVSIPLPDSLCISSTTWHWPSQALANLLHSVPAWHLTLVCI